MPFFYMTKKSRLKILRRQRAFKMKQKAFFIVYIELLLKQLKQTFFFGGKAGVEGLFIKRQASGNRVTVSGTPSDNE